MRKLFFFPRQNRRAISTPKGIKTPGAVRRGALRADLQCGRAVEDDFPRRAPQGYAQKKDAE